MPPNPPPPDRAIIPSSGYVQRAVSEAGNCLRESLYHGITLGWEASHHFLYTSQRDEMVLTSAQQVSLRAPSWEAPTDVTSHPSRKTHFSHKLTGGLQTNDKPRNVHQHEANWWQPSGISEWIGISLFLPLLVLRARFHQLQSLGSDKIKQLAAF